MAAQPGAVSTSRRATESYLKLKQKRAWDLAISPAKSLPMNAFMLYMSGSGVQIFSIGILVMLLFNPFKAVASINAGVCLLGSLPSSIAYVCDTSFRPIRANSRREEAI